MELHVFIEVMAPIPEAYLRMAHAMEEVKKFLIPVRVQMNVLDPEFLKCPCKIDPSSCLQEPGEHDPYMDPHFLNGSQDGSARGRGGHLGRGRGGPPGAGGPR